MAAKKIVILDNTRFVLKMAIDQKMVCWSGLQAAKLSNIMGYGSVLGKAAERLKRAFDDWRRFSELATFLGPSAFAVNLSKGQSKQRLGWPRNDANQDLR